jgi:hypothetical protein
MSKDVWARNSIHSGFKNSYSSTIGGSKRVEFGVLAHLQATINQVMDSPTSAVIMADESEFVVDFVDANGNDLHQQQQPPAELGEGEEHHHDQMMPPETLMQRLNINDGVVDDADDDTDDAVQVVAESCAASNHGDHVDENPCHLQEVEAAAVAVIDFGANIHLPFLSREDVESIMSYPTGIEDV